MSSLQRRGRTLAGQDPTVRRLQQEVQLRKTETEWSRSQLRCLLRLVQGAWQGDETAMWHVSNIVGVQPPFGTHVIREMQREVEGAGHREEEPLEADSSHPVCQDNLLIKSGNCEEQVERDYSRSMASSHNSYPQSTCHQHSNKLELLTLEPPLITRTFSDTELVTTPTADFLRVLRRTVPDLTSTPSTRVFKHTSRQAAELKSSSTATCQSSTKPMVSHTRTVQFQVPNTQPVKLLVTRPPLHSRKLKIKERRGLAKLEENRQQEHQQRTSPVYGYQRQETEENSYNKEVRATRLLQKRLGIGPEGMV